MSRLNRPLRQSRRKRRRQRPREERQTNRILRRSNQQRRDLDLFRGGQRGSGFVGGVDVIDDGFVPLQTSEVSSVRCGNAFEGGEFCGGEPG